MTYNNQSSELKDQLSMQKAQLQGVLKVLEDVSIQSPPDPIEQIDHHPKPVMAGIVQHATPSAKVAAEHEAGNVSEGAKAVRET